MIFHYNPWHAVATISCAHTAPMAWTAAVALDLPPTSSEACPPDTAPSSLMDRMVLSYVSNNGFGIKIADLERLIVSTHWFLIMNQFFQS